MNHESGGKPWIIEVKNDRNHEYQDSNDSASTHENIVNSNNFYSNEIIVSKLRWYGLQFFGAHIFGGGRIFGLLTWEGLKFLGPHFWNNTGPPPPPIVYDRSLRVKCLNTEVRRAEMATNNTKMGWKCDSNREKCKYIVKYWQRHGFLLKMRNVLKLRQGLCYSKRILSTLILASVPATLWEFCESTP